MSNVLRLAIVDPNDASRDALKSTLLGMDMVWLEAECSRYEFFCRRRRPDASRHRHRRARSAIPKRRCSWSSSCTQTRPSAASSSSARSTDGNLILRAMRAGVKEFLHAAGARSKTWSAALERIGDQRFGRGDGKDRGSTVIAVAGATGGVGTTSLAVNLGCALAADPRQLGRPWSTSTCAWATPTCSSTRFPTTRWSTSPRTSRGSTSRCSSGRSPSTRRACTCCRGRCSWKTWR